MFCPRCGSPCSDFANFCPICGADVSQLRQQGSPYQQPDLPHPRRRRRRALIVVAVVAAVLLLGGGVAAALVLGRGAANKTTSEPVVSAETSVAASTTAPATSAATTTARASKSLSIEVQQVDASAFPHVKVYLEIEDPSTGEVPEGLDGMLFYLEREDANASYVRQTVTSVNQLDESEALKIDLVADVSGSMSGEPLDDAQDAMYELITSLQFDAGDEAELTSFADGVYLMQEFTGDASRLRSGVGSLSASGSTAMYDALYTAVERVAPQSGARCVIAFTDGADNVSSTSLDDVEEVALRYRIPIFIIGVGSADYSEVADLAEATGGCYYNIASTVTMADIYQQIYRTEKLLYLMEYDDTSGASANEATNIRIGYAGSDYAGECEYSYTPYILNDVESASIYSSGPEAAVEGYLKNWAPSISKSKYSLIEPYIKDGSALEQTQREYVKNGFDETLDSYEIGDASYSGSDACTVTTRETFYVQVPGEPLQLMTQVTTYSLERVGNDWYLTDIVDQDVPIRINR